MGERGPAPKSAAVLSLVSSRLAPARSLDQEFKPEVEIPDCPSWCWPLAKKEWKRVTVLLHAHGLVSHFDRAALTMYCQAWAEYAWHKTRLNAAMKIAAKKEAEAIAKGEPWTGGDGIMVPTVNGNLVYSHHWVCANKAEQRLDRFIDRFGLAPDVRKRVFPSDNRQGSLFEGPAGEDEWSKSGL